MRKHFRYLTYVLRHKRFVFEAGVALRVPLWQLLIHDWSKFRPDEWRPYSEWFYGLNGGSWHPLLRSSVLGEQLEAIARQRDFEVAFLLHLHRNPHHHQYWYLPSYGPKPHVVFPMPERYLREMVADWIGAGRAISGRNDVLAWYTKNREAMHLHPTTRAQVEHLVGYVPPTATPEQQVVGAMD